MYDRTEAQQFDGISEPDNKQQYKPGGVTWQLTHMQDDIRELEQLCEVLRKRVSPFVDNESPVPAPGEVKPEPVPASSMSQELHTIRIRITDLSYQVSRTLGSIDL